MSASTSGRKSHKDREYKGSSSRQSRRDRHNEAKLDKNNTSDNAMRNSELEDSRNKYGDTDHDHAQQKEGNDMRERTCSTTVEQKKSKHGDMKSNPHRTSLETGNQKNVVKLAKLANSAERYDYMTEYMMEYAKQKKYLDREERDLLWESFRKGVKPFRKSWRVISIVHDDLHSDDTHYKAMVGTFRRKIEKEVEDSCYDVLSLLEDFLIPNNNENDSNDDLKEAKIFYNKLKGDAYRYLWELVVNDKDQNKTRRKYRDLAKESYANAYQDAEKCLDSVHPLRLGLVLNYCVLLYEAVGDANSANDIAKDAIEKADKDLHKLRDKEKKDASSIIDMLEENLSLWKNH